MVRIALKVDTGVVASRAARWTGTRPIHANMLLAAGDVALATMCLAGFQVDARMPACGESIAATSTLAQRALLVITAHSSAGAAVVVVAEQVGAAVVAGGRAAGAAAATTAAHLAACAGKATGPAVLRIAGNVRTGPIAILGARDAGATTREAGAVFTASIVAVAAMARVRADVYAGAPALGLVGTAAFRAASSATDLIRFALHAAAAAVVGVGCDVGAAAFATHLAPSAHAFAV